MILLLFPFPSSSMYKWWQNWGRGFKRVYLNTKMRAMWQWALGKHQWVDRVSSSMDIPFSTIRVLKVQERPTGDALFPVPERRIPAMWDVSHAMEFCKNVLAPTIIHHRLKVPNTEEIEVIFFVKELHD